ncbi:hypothetical protein ACFWFF_04180 [Streptomyces sp. NPDC060223]|uniref:hypothetical protein n=1 Tax=Streptomyces sp. NPDC060223 TaxID=3347077 RepID=UPI00365A22B6
MAYGTDGRPVRRFRVGTPHLGKQGTPHVWEYGVNLIGCTWPVDGAPPRAVSTPSVSRARPAGSSPWPRTVRADLEPVLGSEAA